MTRLVSAAAHVRRFRPVARLHRYDVIGSPFDDVLAAARAGAGWACSRLYESLSGPVTGYARRLGCADPDDVASETFLQVFRDLDRFEGDEHGLRAWVFTIAHRRAVDDLRRAGRRPTIMPVDQVINLAGNAEADASAMAMDEVARIRKHVDMLAPAQRQVVLLRVVGGLTVAETADVMGRRQDAVRQLQRRGLRALAERLSEG